MLFVFSKSSPCGLLSGLSEGEGGLNQPEESRKCSHVLFISCIAGFSFWNHTSAATDSETTGAVQNNPIQQYNKISRILSINFMVKGKKVPNKGPFFCGFFTKTQRSEIMNIYLHDNDISGHLNILHSFTVFHAKLSQYSHICEFWANLSCNPFSFSFWE